MKEIGDIIKELRISKGLNQPELAKIMNVSKQTVSNWENGNRTPDIDTLAKFADFFNVTADYLMGRTDDPNSKIVEANLNGHHYEIEIDKSYPHDLSPEETVALIELLEESGFNIDKLIEKAKNRNRNKNK